MKKIEVLRKKYPRFVYHGYTYEKKGADLHLSFDFSIDPDIRFHPRVVIKSVSRKALERLSKNELNNFVFHLGLIEIPSYWKATCSPTIVVEAGHLTQDQIRWWKDLFLKSMGEFFFQNKIDFTKPQFLKITSLARPSYSHLGRAKENLAKENQKERTLVPVGGGKDAVVTLELLKKAKKELWPLILNPKREQLEIIRLARVGKPIVVERTIDPKLLELNKKGYLNGHTPFSAYLAFLSVFVGALFGTKYIAFSNERSSNEGNVGYLKRVINHQYSKSFEFEKKFREYSKKYLAKYIEYFSFLRPLYELQIARLFAKFPKYFPVFLSCNEAHTTASGTRKPTEQWCCKCAKCLFVFAALHPFVKESELVKIFGRNLFDDSSLIPLMDELVGRKWFKPFECVGTTKESLAAFFLSFATEKNSSPLGMYFAKHILPKHPRMRNDAENILKSWNSKHFLSKELAMVLRKALKES